MNKEWFIFKGTHHLGPFSLKEMEDFFHTGELNAQSLVWREGAEKWEALSRTNELTYLINKPNKKPELPDLPALPDLPDDMPPPMPKALAPQSKVALAPLDIDEPPPIPLDALLNPDGKGRAYSSKPESKLSKNGPRIIFAICALVFALVIGWFAMNEKSSSIQIKAKGLMPAYLEKLQETAALKTPSIVVAMALSLDGKTLFASTNKDGEILSIIKMQSLPKRILGTQEVELLVRGVIKDHVGEFARMQLTKGPQFVPGEYNIEFTGRKVHFLNRQFRFLNGISFFKKLNTTFNYQTTAIIYAGTPREFEKKILEYKDSITNEQLKPFNDKLERLQTFLSILNKSVEDYLLILESLKKPKDISQYEQKYIKEISPILQSLVIAADDLSKKVENQELDTRFRVASYKSQIELGKQIGELGMDMITDTAKMKKIGDKEKSQLKGRFEARYKSIKTQIDSHIIKLQEQINSISK